MEMMRNKKKSFRIIFISIVLLFIVFVVYKNKQRIELLNGDVSYEIGKIISFKQGASVNPWFEYEFYIGDIKYKGKYDILGDLRKNQSKLYNKKYVGKYFYVKYSKTKPKFNEMDVNKPVPDSIVKAHFYYGD